MSSLILPNHLAAKLSKKEVQEEPVEAPKALEQAFVPEADRVLDPSKLPDTALARLPQPIGWRLLVLPYRGKAKTKGDVYLPDEYVERQSLATVVAYVLATGPDAYADLKKFPSGPWCQKGQWVMIGRYAGARFRIEGGEVRIINDDEVIATIADPSDVSSV
jgi:co-chaperonin GroES (HSP10)